MNNSITSGESFIIQYGTCKHGRRVVGVCEWGNSIGERKTVPAAEAPDRPSPDDPAALGSRRMIDFPVFGRFFFLPSAGSETEK